MFGTGLGRLLLRREPEPTRQDLILKHINRRGRGLEIGPNYAPLAPRSDGYDCLSLDLFPTDEVRRRALDDPNIPSELVDHIEPVDIVGSAVDIGPLVNKGVGPESLDYIVSSHNFEHLPDPIRFLQGCAEALKPGGVLSMAIPDMRGCLDYFRWPTTLADWLSAHFERRDRPTEAQVFTAVSSFCHAYVEGEPVVGFPLDTPRSAIQPDRRLREAYETLSRRLAEPNPDYQDCHCWAFTPASIELLLLEVRFLGLTQMDCIEVSGPHGGEFFVHLRRGDGAPIPDSAFYPRREALMRQAIAETAAKA